MTESIPLIYPDLPPKSNPGFTAGGRKNDRVMGPNPVWHDPGWLGMNHPQESAGCFPHNPGLNFLSLTWGPRLSHGVPMVSLKSKQSPSIFHRPYICLKEMYLQFGYKTCFPSTHPLLWKSINHFRWCCIPQIGTRKGNARLFSPIIG